MRIPVTQQSSSGGYVQIRPSELAAIERYLRAVPGGTAIWREFALLAGEGDLPVRVWLTAAQIDLLQRAADRA